MSGLAAATPARDPSLLPRLGRRFAIGYVVVALLLFSIYGFPFELFWSTF